MAGIIDGTFDYLRRGIIKPVSSINVYSISEAEKRIPITANRQTPRKGRSNMGGDSHGASAVPYHRLA